jgi:hypoxanthine phosphoribosyltransferase
MKTALGRVLIPEEEIRRRILDLGRQISMDYGEGAVTLVGILKGSFIFLADLIRAISPEIGVEVDFMAVSSYGDATSTSGTVHIEKDLGISIKGKDVIIVEDIVDTGLTLSYLQEILRARGPHSLKTACLLSKPSRRKIDVAVDYIGFTIDDHIVVGYGLDFAERYRNLPYIAILHPSGASAPA